MVNESKTKKSVIFSKGNNEHGTPAKPVKFGGCLVLVHLSKSLEARIHLLQKLLISDIEAYLLPSLRRELIQHLPIKRARGGGGGGGRGNQSSQKQGAKNAFFFSGHLRFEPSNHDFVGQNAVQLVQVTCALRVSERAACMCVCVREQDVSKGGIQMSTSIICSL